MHAEAPDAFEPILDPAGARAFVYAYSEAAASPALSHAFAERQQAWPLAQLSHTRGDPPCSPKPPQHLRPL